MMDITNELGEIWNEAEELSCSLRELTDDELIDCRESLKIRAYTIMAITEALEERLGKWLLDEKENAERDETTCS